MGQVEKFFINPDQAHLDAQKSRTRQEDLLLSNVKYQLIGKLRTEGALKISVDNFERKEGEVKVKAKFDLRGYKESEFTFKPNHMGNYTLKNFELSLDNATAVQKVYATPIEPIEQEMKFDLGLIQAKEVGRNQFELVYPTVGTIGVLAKENIDIDTVKKLCVLASEAFGIKPQFVGDFKVTEVADDMIPEINSQDKMFELQKEIKSFTTHNNAEKEKGQFVTLRENFVRSIELKAQDIVRKMGFSYSKGSPKILSTDTVLEYVDNKFDGSVMVKAKVSDDVITYALPVVKNNIVMKAKLETYRVGSIEQYKDELNKKINSDIKESLKQDLEVIQANLEADQRSLMPSILGYRAGDVQKVIKTDKNWLPEGIEAGYVLNLHGNQYRVEFEDNGVAVNLVLVS